MNRSIVPRSRQLRFVAALGAICAGLLAVPPEASAGGISVASASLTAGNLSVRGAGATSRSTVTVSSKESTATGVADRGGGLTVSATGFRSSTCRATVADGATSTVAVLTGCSPSTGVPALSSISLSHPSLDTVGSLAVGEVLLVSAVGAATTIAVTSSHPAIAAVSPAAVAVQAGSQQGVFTVTYASRVTASTTVTISATAGAVTKTTTVTLLPPPAVGITPSGPLGPGYIGSDFTTFSTLGTTIALGPGAVGPARFAVIAGQLPPGLALGDLNTSQTPAKHIDNSVFGVPTTAGAFSFTIRGTDANGQQATGTYTITVNAARPLAINPQLPWAPVVGGFSNLWLDASGGSSPYRWAIAAGRLPTGMTLVQDAAKGPLVRITGTPTTAGTFAFTLRLTDARGATTASNLSVTVG